MTPSDDSIMSMMGDPGNDGSTGFERAQARLEACRTSLTDNEINIAIAKAFGIKPERRWAVWYDEDHESGTVDLASREDAKNSAKLCRKNAKEWGLEGASFEIEEYDEWSRSAPRYTEDLNACHEAEKTLSERERKMFVLHLLGQYLGCLPEHFWLCAHATARQRALAFLPNVIRQVFEALKLEGPKL